MGSPKVYVVIVTYNGMRWIERCLDCLHGSDMPLHIVVVDNGSTDGTQDFIRTRYPKVRVVEAGKNLGFGQGNNIGLRLAVEEAADHVFLLNQDAYVQPATISHLVRCQRERPVYGILSPVHLTGDGKALDEHFHFFLAKSGTEAFFYNAFVGEPLPPIIDTPFVNAAAWLISRECLLKTGGFDPIFFHYGEDDNYAQRVIYKGFRSGIGTEAFVLHDHDRTQAAQNHNIRKQAQKDWIILLNQVCDVNKSGYKATLYKRLARYSLSLLPAAVSMNRDALYYNYFMAKKILRIQSAVTRSRRTAANDSGTPHLS